MPHIHEKIDFVADIFIVYNNKVFLRKHDKYKIWLSVGGHVELDEDPNQAAIREAKEESGLDVVLYKGGLMWENNKGSDSDFSMIVKNDPNQDKDLIPPLFMHRHKISDTHEHISLVYFATATSDKIEISDDAGDRSDEYGWFSKEDLDKLDLHDRIRFYAETALETLAS